MSLFLIAFVLSTREWRANRAYTLAKFAKRIQLLFSACGVASVCWDSQLGSQKIECSWRGARLREVDD